MTPIYMLGNERLCYHLRIGFLEAKKLDNSMYFGNMCQTTALPSLVRPTVVSAQPSPELKTLLPFSLFPGFNEVNHFHKALIGPGFRLIPPLRRRPSSCGLCRLRFNSEAQATSHYSGTKHARRIKAREAPDCKPRTPDTATKETTFQNAWSPTSRTPSSDQDATAVVELAPPSVSELPPTSSGTVVTMEMAADPSVPPCPGTEGEEKVEVEVEEETEEEKAIRLLYCSLCKVAVNSASQLQAHNSGTKHKTMLEARSGEGAIKSFPRAGLKAKLAPPSEVATGLQNKTFHCEICDVHVNSETQLKQHISSRRHKDRAAGKPAKPKFSPYPPPQRHHGLQTGPTLVHLALRKEQDLTKPLTPCLLQRHLPVAAVAAMAALPPFHLCPASTTASSLFQSPQLSQALLHPAPGPIRSAHSTALFSPY
ncbi:zinc finger protein 385D-like [Aplochiton taeniatus]